MTITTRRPRGHWPRGRRRHDPGPAWPTVRLALAELLAEHPRARRISRRALAVVVGVTPRTIQRWLAGTHVPDQRHAMLVMYWVRAEWIRIQEETRP